ncbi:ABC transporter substrate-binding protein [Bosea sp. F3-2]|uniref:ABC transporter substrate-binding protein n=1 Tax=Bosea sp. F3-2 TaxID=2599640 RepID=UPI001656043F|nr:ABC transporter substrate-binding protein [Bosea sp. F3-2]
MLVNGGPGAFHEAWRRTFAQDCAQLGLIEGRDFTVEPRFAEGQLGRLPELATEHVRQGVDVIVALGGPAANAARRATPTIPVIFAIVTDPVALGLAETAQRPGRNATGITSLDPRQAEAQMRLLKDVFPGMERVAALSDQTIPGADASGLAPIDRANKAAAEALGLRPQIVKLPAPTAAAPDPDFDAAFAAMVRDSAQAVVVFDTPLNFSHGKRLADLAVTHRLPTMFAGGMSAVGGLITYGTSVADTWRRLPAFIDRIFKGTPPGEIPVEFITRRELIFNLKVAQSIGVTIPPELLARADQVIR